MFTRARSHLFLLAAAAAGGACGDSATAPPAESPDLAAVKFWESGATVAWNAKAVELAAATTVNIFRLNLYLALAQFRAAEAAQAVPGAHPPIGSAIGGASAAILAAFFPASTSAIEAALDAQQAAESWPGAKHENFAAGEAIGRATAARVLTYAAGDNVGATDPNAPPTGPVPIGPGYWIWNGLPMARGNLGARPVFLATADEFRPGPPPAFGSDAFNTALAEVRQISDNRTPEQLAVAIYWHVNQSPASLAAPMGIARELIVSHRVKDAEAAKIMFLASATAFDALVACFDAKYEYWFIRPPHADPAIVVPFTMPNHPSYPSAHSCITGAIMTVLAAEFPSESGRLADVADESSISRVYAGIHYRFDLVAGLDLGRAVAGKALAADLDEVAVK
jgi:hypothetical protein